MMLLAWIFMTVLILIFSIGSCRILSMTFQSFSRTVTIKNDTLAEMLIAYKNTWGIATDPKKRNKMSLLGVISYMLFSPQIVFTLYDFWIYFSTGVAEFCYAEETYICIMTFYYGITMSIKIVEANRYDKGKIW